jgi:hypothetical protein
MDEFMSKELKKTIEEKNEQRKKFVEWILERQNNLLIFCTQRAKAGRIQQVQIAGKRSGSEIRTSCQ